MQISVLDGFRRIELGPRIGFRLFPVGSAIAPTPLADTQIVLSDPSDAEVLLRRFFRDAGNMSRLRTALSNEIRAVARYSDDEVRRQVAWRLASGSWLAHAIETKPDPGYSLSAPVERVSEVVEDPPAGPSPASSQFTFIPVQSTTESTSSEQNWLSDVNQDAQAATLEQAARDHVPFCAVCEAARLARAGKGE